MKKLQIGDKIYATDNYGIDRVMQIARITPTLAITAGGNKFKINTVDGFCHKVPKDDPWTYNGLIYYQLETQELKDAFKKQKLVEMISKLDFKKLDLKTLIEINNKLTEIKN